MLTTYLFRYTPECTISQSNFLNFLSLRRHGGIDPLTKILRTLLVIRSTTTQSPVTCVECVVSLRGFLHQRSEPPVLQRCWLGGRKGIRPVKTQWWGAGVVICLERGADLHMAQLMPLPLTVSCFSKIQIGFTFLVPGHPGSPGQRAVKRVCVTVCVCVCSEP